MEAVQNLSNTIALTMGASWASGINLYAAMLALGVAGATGQVALPEGMLILQNPLVIGAAGCMYCAEFVADKIPGVDTGWDVLHTFVRIPAGAMLAAGAVGDVAPSMELVAGLVGGGMATASHMTKAGGRVVINTSPEPVTNWTASVTEDLAVFAGIWAALNHPILFLLLLLAFIAFVAWILPKIWRGIRYVARKIGSMFGWVKEEEEVDQETPSGASSRTEELAQLRRLLDNGTLTQEEFDKEKRRILGDE